MTAWLTDFRPDVAKLDIPVLVLHGSEDRNLPIASTAARLPALNPNIRLVTVEGGPHNLPWTHVDPELGRARRARDPARRRRRAAARGRRAGHKRDGRADDPVILEETRRYLRDYIRVEAETTTARDLYDRVLAPHPDRVNPGAVWGGTLALRPAAR